MVRAGYKIESRRRDTDAIINQVTAPNCGSQVGHAGGSYGFGRESKNGLAFVGQCAQGGRQAVLYVSKSQLLLEIE